MINCFFINGRGYAYRFFEAFGKVVDRRKTDRLGNIVQSHIAVKHESLSLFNSILDQIIDGRRAVKFSVQCQKTARRIATQLCHILQVPLLWIFFHDFTARIFEFILRRQLIVSCKRAVDVDQRARHDHIAFILIPGQKKGTFAVDLFDRRCQIK